MYVYHINAINVYVDLNYTYFINNFYLIVLKLFCDFYKLIK